jgi:hypothetical protein
MSLVLVSNAMAFDSRSQSSLDAILDDFCDGWAIYGYLCALKTVWVVHLQLGGMSVISAMTQFLGSVCGHE